jgi:hypothetical protein
VALNLLLDNPQDNSPSDTQEKPIDKASQGGGVPSVPVPKPEPRNFFADLLTREQLAPQLQTTIRTLDRWESLKIGPPRIILGGSVLYRVAAVREWLLKREQQPLSARRPYTHRKRPEQTLNPVKGRAKRAAEVASKAAGQAVQVEEASK